MFGTEYFMTEREQEENITYTQFKKKALEINIKGNKSAWEMLAGDNVVSFLKSEFPQG